MALIVPGGLAPAISGKANGSVFARNRYGQYVRSFVKPVNPNTTFQIAVRDVLTTLTIAWKALSTADQTAWKAYADATPRINRVGNTVTLAANAMFIACNSIALLAGQDTHEAAPLTPGLADLGTITLTGASSNDLIFAIAGGEWNTTGGALLIFTSPAQSAGVNFYRGPYRVAGTLTGGTATLTGGTVTAAFPLGDKNFVRVQGIDPDGRLTPQGQLVFLP